MVLLDCFEMAHMNVRKENSRNWDPRCIRMQLVVSKFVQRIDVVVPEVANLDKGREKKTQHQSHVERETRDYDIKREEDTERERK